MDSTGATLNALRKLDEYAMVALFLIFILLSSMTVMNMLIGVLCEVISAVGEAEKENAAIELMKKSVLIMLKRLDADGSGEISKDELDMVLVDPEAQEVLQELQVD